MELAEYNGWENKFTWLIHLHLSNEHCVMQEIMALVAQAPDERRAGLQVKWWVEDMVTGWITGFAGRETSYDGRMRLLIWDVVGAALAYADWDGLVKLLMGQTLTCDNPLTLTLHKSIMAVHFFYESAHALLQAASSPFVCADALQGWFREQVDVWVDGSYTYRWEFPSVFLLVQNLILDVYGVVCWEHVARAFRVE